MWYKIIEKNPGARIFLLLTNGENVVVKLRFFLKYTELSQCYEKNYPIHQALPGSTSRQRRTKSHIKELIHGSVVVLMRRMIFFLFFFTNLRISLASDSVISIFFVLG